jgi:DNA-binding XRE family transcriptional regulator
MAQHNGHAQDPIAAAFAEMKKTNRPLYDKLQADPEAKARLVAEMNDVIEDAVDPPKPAKPPSTPPPFPKGENGRDPKTGQFVKGYAGGPGNPTFRKLAAGLSQQELATKAGLSMSLIAQLEQGFKDDPKLSTVRALANTLGVTLDELAGDIGAEPKGKRKG